MRGAGNRPISLSAPRGRPGAGGWLGLPGWMVLGLALLFLLAGCMVAYLVPRGSLERIEAYVGPAAASEGVER